MFDLNVEPLVCCTYVFCIVPILINTTQHESRRLNWLRTCYVIIPTGLFGPFKMNYSAFSSDELNRNQYIYYYFVHCRGTVGFFFFTNICIFFFFSRIYRWERCSPFCTERVDTPRKTYSFHAIHTGKPCPIPSWSPLLKLDIVGIWPDKIFCRYRRGHFFFFFFHTFIIFWTHRPNNWRRSLWEYPNFFFFFLRNFIPFPDESTRWQGRYDRRRSCIQDDIDIPYGTDYPGKYEIFSENLAYHAQF